jgi:hypothetical protein
VCTTDTCDPEDAGADVVTGCVNEDISCDDDATCTTDTCDAVDGCDNAPNNASCPSQPNMCVVADSGVCDPDDAGALDPSGCTYTALVCNDNIGCTTDGCNLGTGCTVVNNNAACPNESGSDCEDDGTGVCDPGAGGADPVSGCRYAATDCSDAFTCTSESCVDPGGCDVTENDAVCTDANPNTDDTCDPAAPTHDPVTGCTGLTCALLCAGAVDADCGPGPTACGNFATNQDCLDACALWNAQTRTCVDTTSRTGVCADFQANCGLAVPAGTDCL